MFQMTPGGQKSGEQLTMAEIRKGPCAHSGPQAEQRSITYHLIKKKILEQE